MRSQDVYGALPVRFACRVSTKGGANRFLYLRNRDVSNGGFQKQMP